MNASNHKMLLTFIKHCKDNASLIIMFALQKLITFMYVSNHKKLLTFIKHCKDNSSLIIMFAL